jgi:hypothetical protein
MAFNNTGRLLVALPEEGRKAVQRALRNADLDIKTTAKALDTTERNMHRWINKLGIRQWLRDLRLMKKDSIRRSGRSCIKKDNDASSS